MRSINPNLSAGEIVKILMKTVRRVPHLKKKIRSGGIIDVEAAVSEAQRRK